MSDLRLPWKKPLARPTTLFLAVVFACSMDSPTATGQPNNQTMSDDRQTMSDDRMDMVTPNKSVSLQTTPDAALARVGDESVQEQPIENPNAEHEAVSNQPPASRKFLPSWRKRNATSTAGGDGATAATSTTPWYRTGFGALAIVLCALGGVAFLVRRWIPTARQLNGSLVRIVGRTNISTKQSLVLVRLGRRLVLVGASPDRLDSIAEISDPHEVAELIANLPTDGLKTSERFNSMLMQEAGDFKETCDGVDSSSQANVKRAYEGSYKAGALGGLLTRLRALKIR